MKKLLSFLGVIAIGVAPAATVIACGETNKNEEKDNDQVIKNNIMALNAEDILNILTGDYGPEGIFGTDQAKVLDQFMKVFAYGFTKEIHDELKSDHKENPDQPNLKNLEKTTNSNYANDDFMKIIDEKYQDFDANITAEWNEKVKEAEKNDDYKSDFDQKFKEALEKEFNKKHEKWQDYENDFKLQKIANDQNNPLNLLSQEIIENFAKGTGRNQTNDIINGLRTNLFTSNRTIKNISIDFAAPANSLTLRENQSTGVARQNSWFGQFDNFLKGLQELSKSQDEADINTYNDLVQLLINMINVTGGLNLEASLEKDINTLTISEVKWATLNNIRAEVLDQDEATIQQWSNKLLKRMDNRYEEHFGNNVEPGKPIQDGILNLNANGEVPKLKVNYRNLFKTTPNFSSEVLANQPTTGLVSNSQRYFTNLYYEQKKPVAITEFVVEPWESGSNIIEFKDEINSAPYISTANGKYIGLYNFINVFINSAISGTTASTGTPKDQTKEMFDGESAFSWDILLNNAGSLKGISHNGSENNPNSWIPNATLWNEFEDNLKLVNHQSDGLLTVDSTKYNDTLKYAIYDFLQNPDAAEYNSWNTDNRPKYSHDTDISSLNTDNQKYATAIAGLIHSLDRSGQANATEKGHSNVYQVLNKEQGILAYTADDGIHFVRIEGYPILKNQADLLGEQKKLTTKTDEFNTTFATYQQYGENLGTDSQEAEKTANNLITTDYSQRNNVAENIAKIRYQDLNNTFGNKYLEFLINASLATVVGDSKAKYNFDLNNDVRQWIAINSKDQQHYWIGIWDYLKEVFGIKNDGDLFDMFFSLASEDKENLDLLKAYRENILDTLNVFRKTSLLSNREFANSWTTYEQKHESIEENHAIVQYTPWNYISSWSQTPGDHGKIVNVRLSKNWQYDNKAASEVTYDYHINFMNYLVWDQQTQISNIKEGKVS